MIHIHHPAIRHTGEWALPHSDIEHEVMFVKSGYRVTLIYNLYFGNAAETTVNIPLTPSVQHNELAVKTALTELLSDSTFLSKGGGLGLWAVVPVPDQPQVGTLGGIE
jgi:hypothetical protein